MHLIQCQKFANISEKNAFNQIITLPKKVISICSLKEYHIIIKSSLHFSFFDLHLLRTGELKLKQDEKTNPHKKILLQNKYCWYS